MAYVPTDLRDLREAPFDDVIDVRATSEFAEDHVPDAMNLPVLSDSERSRVGTIYKQESPFRARKIGAALVARNAAAHVVGPLHDKDGGWRALIYCWRGGQRSNSFASILSQIGWRVDVLEGGYRSYRRLVKVQLYDTEFPAPVILLDGYTGTAKTALLYLARARGTQIIDLEGLANHRGSVLGGMGPQPSQKAFESALAQEIATLDPARPVLIEAESSKVGQLSVPPAIWAAMRGAPRWRIEAPIEARARYLQRAYADIADAPDRIEERLRSLIPIQGHARVNDWCAMARAGRGYDLTRALIERHYDPRYARRRGSADVVLDTEDLDPDALERLADRIVRRLDDLG